MDEPRGERPGAESPRSHHNAALQEAMFEPLLASAPLAVSDPADAVAGVTHSLGFNPKACSHTVRSAMAADVGGAVGRGPGAGRSL